MYESAHIFEDGNLDTLPIVPNNRHPELTQSGITHDTTKPDIDLSFSLSGGRIKFHSNKEGKAVDNSTDGLTFDPTLLTAAFVLRKTDHQGRIVIPYVHIKDGKPTLISNIRMSPLQLGRMITFLNEQVHTADGAKTPASIMSKYSNKVRIESDSDPEMIMSFRGEGRYTMGQRFIQTLDGNEQIGMKPEDFIDFVAAHELTHGIWDTLSESDIVEIIDAIDPTSKELKLFLNRFDYDLPYYGDEANRVFQTHKDPNRAFLRPAYGDKPERYLDKKYVLNELFAFASWSVLGLSRKKLEGIIRPVNGPKGFSQTSERLCKYAWDMIDKNPNLKRLVFQKIYDQVATEFPAMRMQVMATASKMRIN